MAAGGMYDHLGGGFARYSVDERWLVPHFEKMLYDNALLTRAYLHAWQLTGEVRHRQVVEETVGYVLRDLRHPGGAFYSAEDADSEGEEGKFYVWSLEEVRAVGGQACVDWYGVTEAGNFEGHNILNRLDHRGELLRPPEVEAGRQRLFDARSQRVRPGLDDKALTEWNALMLSALAEAAVALGRADWLEAAEANGRFLLDQPAPGRRALAALVAGRRRRPPPGLRRRLRRAGRRLRAAGRGHRPRHVARRSPPDGRRPAPSVLGPRPRRRCSPPARTPSG